MKKTTMVGALCTGILLCGTLSTAHAVAISGQGTWESTLLGRDLDGNAATFEAYYDTSLDITWLADANHAGSTMDWATANAWAASLNPYGSGITGWRLPTLSSIDGTTANDAVRAYDGSMDRGYNISAPGAVSAGSTASELAHLFYNTLGNSGLCDPATSTVATCIEQSGWGLSNTGPFSNMASTKKRYAYWFDKELALNTNNAWAFRFYDGYQSGGGPKSDSLYAWAVYSGDVSKLAVPVHAVSAVPLPAAAWLFGSGLLGLVGVSRRRER